ncbi:hypothetical protein HDV02_002478 [Globomyces sp. JEL0801]|nr:hypothetical protein HDV02_002478 [Globomyces sp. JEL0801]
MSQVSGKSIEELCQNIEGTMLSTTYIRSKGTSRDVVNYMGHLIESKSIAYDATKHADSDTLVRPTFEDIEFDETIPAVVDYAKILEESICLRGNVLTFVSGTRDIWKHFGCNPQFSIYSLYRSAITQFSVNDKRTMKVESVLIDCDKSKECGAEYTIALWTEHAWLASHSILDCLWYRHYKRMTDPIQTFWVSTAVQANTSKECPNSCVGHIWYTRDVRCLSYT